MIFVCIANDDKIKRAKSQNYAINSLKPMLVTLWQGQADGFGLLSAKTKYLAHNLIANDEFCHTNKHKTTAKDDCTWTSQTSKLPHL
ncbi:hypothetical protein B0189_06105 [Moraxella cuniculi]|nr:hypothetical protein B0189_06105 [Moraxella cuniculi]